MAHVRSLTRSDGTPAFEVRWRQAEKFKQRTFKVKREAERFALRVEDEVEQGNSTDIYVRRSKTLADVVGASMAASASKLRPKTYGGYEAAYRLHVLPSFGTRRIVSITSQEVELWVQSLVAKGMAPASVRGAFIALNKCFKYAQRHDLVVKNPCTGTPLPAKPRKETRFLSPAEVDLLAGELDLFEPYGLVVRFAAYTGLRAGEIAGLQIRDVNLLRKVLRVDRAVQRVTGKGLVYVEPKTERSHRYVPVRSSLADELASYLSQHPRRNEPEVALWPGREVGGDRAADYNRLMDPASFYRYYLKPAAARAGLGAVRAHDLRHTYAAIMAASGIEIQKVCAFMGHHSISVTVDTYGHLYESDFASDMDRLDAYVHSASASVPTWRMRDDGTRG